MKYYSHYFSQAYGQGTYGTGEYSCTDQHQNDGTCTVVAGTGGSNGGGTLANTGVAVALFVTLACLIMFVSFVVRIWRRPKLVPQEIESNDPNPTDSNTHA